MTPARPAGGDPNHETSLPRRSLSAPRGSTRWPLLTVVWLFAIVAVVASRNRAQWDFYVAMHRWVATLGVPDAVRRFDYVILYAAAAYLGAGAVSCWEGTAPTRALRLVKGFPGWAAMALVSLVPMVVGGAIVGLMGGGLPSDFEPVVAKILSGVIRAPIAEEVLFRGLLVSVPAVALGWSGRGFWRNASVAALFFASIHVEWNTEGIANGWPTLMVTGIGGIWYSWLLSRWQTLWVPMTLHAGMNLGWLLAGAAGGAGGGGLLINLLRAMTIIITTYWTVRKAPACRRGHS